MNKKKVWQRVLEELEVSVTRPYFESYFKQMWIMEIENLGDLMKISLACSSAFHQIEVERRFGKLLTDAFSKAVGEKVELEYKVGKKKTKTIHEDAPLIDFAKSRSVVSVEDKVRDLGLRTEYTLENFAVSSSNEMAYAAARAVAQNPGRAYNPLFLYGGVGVGKTHLMQSVGQALVRKKDQVKLVYCSGETFTNEIIEAIRKKSTPKFRSKYRRVDLLLIDDIQFIAGKLKVQEEFFHTFNTISGAGGQVIMTSDKQPREIEGLEERLRSRFEGGLAIDIGQPDFELRSAILMIKARQIGVDLPTDAAQEIASFEADTRAMLGLFMKVVAYAQMRDAKVDVSISRKVIGDLKDEKVEKRGEVKPVEVIGVVADYYKTKPGDIRGPRRLKTLTLPRHLAMYLLKTDFQMGLVEIGKWFNNRDHTSVMHAVGKVDHLLKTTPDFSDQLEDIRKQIYG